MTRRLAVLVPALALLPACGYRVAGRADLLPKEIRTIAVPAFGNVTTRYKLADRLGASLTRELIQRTRYTVVADPNQADATLSGVLVSFTGFPTVFDSVTGRAAAVQVVAVLQVSLRRRDGTLLFTRPTLEVRERYEVSVDERAYFDESDAAADRMSRDIARGIVSAVLEAF